MALTLRKQLIFALQSISSNSRLYMIYRLHTLESVVGESGCPYENKLDFRIQRNHNSTILF